MSGARFDIRVEARDEAKAVLKDVSAALRKVGKDTAKLQTEQARMSGVMGRVRHGFQRLTGALSAGQMALAKFGLAVAGLRAIKDAGQQVVQFATDVAEFGDQLAKTAPRIGMTVESMQEFDYVLKINGTSMDRQVRSFVRFNRTVNDASLGSKTAMQALERLGVEIKNVDGTLRPAEELLMSTADGFAGMADGVEKTAIAATIFGRAGTELLQTMNMGSEGIAKLRTEIHDLNGVMSDEAAAASERAVDAMTRLDTALDGLKRNMGELLLPIIEKFSNGMAFLVANLTRGQPTAEEWGRKIAKHVRGEADRAEKSVQNLNDELERFATDGITSAETTAAYAAASKEAEIATRGLRIEAAGYWKEAEDLAGKWFTTYGRGQEGRKKLDAEVERLQALARSKEAEALNKRDSIFKSYKATLGGLKTEQHEEVQLMMDEVRIMEGGTITAIEYDRAKRKLIEATKAGSTATMEHIRLLFQEVYALGQAKQEAEKKSRGGGGRGITRRAETAALEKLRNQTEAYAKTLEAEDEFVKAAIARDLRKANVDTDLAQRQTSKRQANVALAKSEFDYAKAVDAATAASRAEFSAAIRRNQLNDLELQQAKLSRAAVHDLTAAEQAALEVERARLEVQKAKLAITNEEQGAVHGLAMAQEALVQSEMQLDRATVAEDLQAQAKGYEAAANAMRGVSGTMGRMNSDMGALASGLGKAAALNAKYTDSEEGKAAAMDGGIAVVGQTAAALVDGEKKQAAILAAMELARGVASFSNPVKAAAHFTAAGMFGAIATGVVSTTGGSKAASASAGGGGGGGPGFRQADAGGEGQTQQVVVTFGDGVVLGSPGEVGKAVAQATGALGGTGMQTGGVF